MPKVHAPWGQLTTLKLRVAVPLNMAHSILAQYSLITHCTLMVADNNLLANADTKDHGKITLSQLRILKLGVEFEEDDCGMLVAPLILPSLTHLRFFSSHDTPWAHVEGVTALIVCSARRSGGISFEQDPDAF
jgi:hypothetical protein